MQRISTITKVLDLFGAGKHGFRDGDLVNGISPTDLDAAWFNGAQEELLAIIEGAGIAADAAVLTQVRQAIKRLAGGNVRTITAAGPTALTADDAGFVVIDASANAVAITLPAVNVVAGAPLTFKFVRADATTNTVTVSRAGTDVFVGGATSFTLTGQADCRTIVGDSVSKWAITALLTVAAGSVIHVAMSTAPAGYLKANGAAVSRTTYAALFTAIGTVFGVGDGATTFNLPDLRGEFLRGWDDARGIDSGRSLGSAQANQNLAHIHQIERGTGLGIGLNVGGFSHRLTGYALDGISEFTAATAGGNEARPRNIALLACIKY